MSVCLCSFVLVGGDGDIIVHGVRFSRGGGSWWWSNEWVVGVDIGE